MSSQIKIFLDSPSGSYYAGTSVSGRVICQFNKPETARGLKIKILGEANVSWTATESVRKNDGNTENESVRFHAQEEYFSNKYYLIGSANGEIELPSGETIYPFSVTLPPRLPSSFDGEHGHVRYSIKVSLDRAWKSDIEAKSIFNVITPLDLNFIQIAKNPTKKETSKYFCCCCCKNGPLTLVLWIPYSGVVPGQDLPVTIEVDNASSVEIEAIKCKITKVIKWVARQPRYDTKVDTVEIFKLSLEGVAAHGSKTITQTLTFPNMPYTNLDDCSIIDVNFFLLVAAQVGGCRADLSTQVPLMLGTVPISNAAMPNQPSLSLQPVITTAPAPGFLPTNYLDNQNVAPSSNYQTPYPPADPSYPSPAFNQPPPYQANLPYPPVQNPFDNAAPKLPPYSSPSAPPDF